MGHQLINMETIIFPTNRRINMNEIFRNESFAIEVIARGQVLDNDQGYNGAIFAIETATIRINHAAMNEYTSANMWNTRECYDSEEEWIEYKQKKEEKKEDFKRKIAEKLGYDEKEELTVTQNISEIFTAVRITKVIEALSSESTD